MHVQAFIAHAPVEGLNVRVIPGPPRTGKVELYAAVERPRLPARDGEADIKRMPDTRNIRTAENNFNCSTCTGVSASSPTTRYADLINRTIRGAAVSFVAASASLP